MTRADTEASVTIFVCDCGEIVNYEMIEFCGECKSHTQAFVRSQDLARAQVAVDSLAAERDQYRAALERVTERPEYAAKIAFGALEGKD